jgi:hypothetical protein
MGSLVRMAAWLNPHLTTGYAVEVSKFFNIQPIGMQFMLERLVASGLPMEEARAVQGGPVLKQLDVLNQPGKKWPHKVWWARDCSQLDKTWEVEPRPAAFCMCFCSSCGWAIAVGARG